MRRQIVGLVFSVVTAVGSFAGEPTKSIPTRVFQAGEAKNHIGETLTFSFTVKHANDGIHEKSYFLDSEADYKDPDNLAVVIGYEYADGFKKAGIADVVSFYAKKKIKVTGLVINEKKQTRIRVTTPKQIEIDALSTPAPKDSTQP